MLLINAPTGTGRVDPIGRLSLSSLYVVAQTATFDACSRRTTSSRRRCSAYISSIWRCCALLESRAERAAALAKMTADSAPTPAIQSGAEPQSIHVNFTHYFLDPHEIDTAEPCPRSSPAFGGLGRGQPSTSIPLPDLLVACVVVVNWTIDGIGARSGLRRPGPLGRICGRRG